MMTDSELIQSLGGPAKVASMLGYPKHGGTQRVQNWLGRGIPPKVKVDHPEIFLGADGKELSKPDQSAA